MASQMTRRTVLRGGLASLAALVATACKTDAEDTSPVDTGLGTPPRVIPDPLPLRSLIDEIGELGEPNELGMRLPPGFSARIIARSGKPVLPGSDYLWHLWPDGGAVYATEDGGWIYVSNCELPIVGGVGAVRFDTEGTIVAAYPILEGTNINCAGGKTPWHTWLSCEEIDRGRVFECDPWGEAEAVERPALGRFKHEAAAVDPVNAHIYLTEDESNGRLYRFVPDQLTEAGHPDLTAGTLEVAVVTVDEDGGGDVAWVTVPDPLASGEVPTRLQVAEATVFNGGEGIWYHDGVVYFATKGDDRVWALTIASNKLRVLYHRATSETPILSGVDNVTVSCCGDVLIAEDGGSMQIIVILPSGELRPLMQIVGQDSSEVTGPAFDPSGTRLYFSSQRAEGLSNGITYEISGPFHEPA